MFGKNSDYPPIDISVKMVQTKNGRIQVVTTAEERKRMRASLKKKNPKIPIIETKPVPKKDELSWIDDIEDMNAIFDN